MSAADVARAALLDSAPADHIGGSLDAVHGEDGVTTYAFECAHPGYPGWYWAVSVFTLDGESTVSEVNLLPGADALVPPAWQPWSTRVQSGDLGVGDLLATPESDERLTAGFTEVPEDEAIEFRGTQWELGLGRVQILSVAGMDLAVERWLAGQNGPRAAMAKAAPANCSTCGFLVAVGGGLGQAFGICGNEYGAADGQLVAMSFGCGAHSSVRIDHIPPVPVVELVIDDDADAVEDATALPDFVAEPIVAHDAAAESAETPDDQGDDALAADGEARGDADDSDDDESDPDESDDDSDEDDDDPDNDSDDDSDEADDDDEDDEPDADGRAESRESDFFEHLDEDALDWNPKEDL